MKETFDKECRARSILKAVSWRIIGTADTVVLSWIMTGRVLIALSIGSAELITKLILYYLHERAWQLIPRGTIRRWLNLH